MAIFGANKLANSHTLFKNYIIGAVITFIGAIVIATAATAEAGAIYVCAWWFVCWLYR